MDQNLVAGCLCATNNDVKGMSNQWWVASTDHFLDLLDYHSNSITSWTLLILRLKFKYQSFKNELALLNNNPETPQSFAKFKKFHGRASDPHEITGQRLKHNKSGLSFGSLSSLKWNKGNGGRENQRFWILQWTQSLICMTPKYFFQIFILTGKHWYIPLFPGWNWI